MEEYKTLFTAIEDSAKCPVCLDRVRSPATLCNNGHAICSECKQQQLECPTCRAPFSNINPVFVNLLIELLPAPCRNASRGCHQFLNRETMKKHEVECEFRLVRCRVHGCRWEEEITQLLNHFQINHVTSVLPESSTIVSPDFIVSDEEYSATLIASEGCLFWIYTTNNFYKKQIPVFVQCVHKSATVDQCSCEIQFIKEHFVFSYKQLITTMESVDDVVASTLAKQFLITPNSVLPNFVNNKYEIEFLYKLKFEFKHD